MYSTGLNYNILEDETATGKKRDWKGKKSRADLMAKHYEGLNERIGGALLQQAGSTNV